MAKAKSTGHLLKRPLVLLVVFIVVEVVCAALLLRPLRGLFPVPHIGMGQNATVGYAVYAGYPMYFDTIFLSLIIFLPIMFLVVLKLTHSYED